MNKSNNLKKFLYLPGQIEGKHLQEEWQGSRKTRVSDSQNPKEKRDRQFVVYFKGCTRIRTIKKALGFQGSWLALVRVYLMEQQTQKLNYKEVREKMKVSDYQ